MMKYKSVALYNLSPVTAIVNIFYRGLPKERTVESSTTSNPYWELFYIDRGNISLEINNENITLSSGQAILYAPNSSHRLCGTENNFINALSLSFISEKLNTDAFGNIIYTFDAHEKNLISKLITIGNRYFQRFSIQPNGVKGMRPKDSAPEYVIPFVKASIEYLLMLIFQHNFHNSSDTIKRQHYSTPIINQAIEFMFNNVNRKLSLEEIARSVNMSSSRFRTLFRTATNHGVIDYFNNIKIEQAKILIRKGCYSFYEIAEKLGYSSVSYFSRHFKQKTDMTPTEYSRLVNYNILPVDVE